MRDDVDIVIMWVDGSDPYFLARHQEAVDDLAKQGIQIKMQKGRHRDNGELFFLLRAITAFLPWYRKIHIVTNGQTPKYVDFSRDDIAMVTHAEIFPRPKDAPGFNTFAIESAINNIPDLAENYVRFSDDFFVGAPVSIADIAGPHGHGQFYFGGRYFNMRDTLYHRTLQFNAVRFWKSFGYLPLLNTLHVPQFRKRSYMAAMLDNWPKWIAQTQASKFRTDRDAIGLFLYPYFVIEHYMDKTYDEVVQDIFAGPNKDWGGATYRQINLGQKTVDWRAKLGAIAQDRPKFFNLNDNMQDGTLDDILQTVGGHLYDIYPRPSPFEKPGAPLPPLAATQ